MRSATEIGVVIFCYHWRSACRVGMGKIKKTGGGSDTGAWVGSPKPLVLGISAVEGFDLDEVHPDAEGIKLMGEQPLRCMPAKLGAA